MRHISPGISDRYGALYFQENLLTVKKIQKQPHHCNITGVKHNLFPGFRQKSGKSPKKESGNTTDHSKRQCPFFPSSNIYHIIEQCKQGKAVGSHHEHERTAPQRLVDRARQTPQKSCSKKYKRCHTHITCLTRLRDSLFSDKVSGKHTEQCSNYGRKSADQSQPYKNHGTA